MALRLPVRQRQLTDPRVNKAFDGNRSGRRCFHHPLINFPCRRLSVIKSPIGEAGQGREGRWEATDAGDQRQDRRGKQVGAGTVATRDNASDNMVVPAIIQIPILENLLRF